MAKKFIRKDTHKKKRLALVWRKPKGITNKKRLRRKGHSANVNPGFGTKASDRGKNKQGLMITLVYNLDQLKKINPKTQSALLAGVGKKKKVELIAEAEKLKIILVNFNSKKYSEGVEKFLLQKKKDTATKKEEKIEDAKEAKEKVKEKEAKDAKEEEKTPEQKKKEEKAEKDKVLLKGDK